MALREFKAPVNYEAQQSVYFQPLPTFQHRDPNNLALRMCIFSGANIGPEGFEEFLKDFKTSPEHTIATALGDITIDEDELSDDAMDEDTESVNRRRQEKQHQREPQHKYMDLLQRLADRTIQEIVIDLDDLATVSSSGTCAGSVMRDSSHFSRGPY